MARSPALAGLFRQPALTAQLHYEICKAYYADGTSAQLTAVMSCRLGTPGQCRARMRAASGLISARQASVPPRAAWTPEVQTAVPRAERADQRPSRGGGLHVTGPVRVGPRRTPPPW